MHLLNKISDDFSVGDYSEGVLAEIKFCEKDY